MQSDSPNIAPARGPPLWEGCDAQAGEGIESELEVGLVARAAALMGATMAGFVRAAANKSVKRAA